MTLFTHNFKQFIPFHGVWAWVWIFDRERTIDRAQWSFYTQKHQPIHHYINLVIPCFHFNASSSLYMSTENRIYQNEKRVTIILFVLLWTWIEWRTSDLNVSFQNFEYHATIQRYHALIHGSWFPIGRDCDILHEIILKFIAKNYHYGVYFFIERLLSIVVFALRP